MAPSTKGCRKCGKPFEGERCKPCRFKSKTKWRKAHLKLESDRVARWRKKNTEKVKAGWARLIARDPVKQMEKKKETTAKWKAVHPEALRLWAHNRRAKKRGNGGKLSNGLSDRLFKLQNGKCPCCGLPLGKDPHLDHILPLDLGGANVDSNMQLLRKGCNLKKHTKHPVDFMQSRGFLL